MSLTSPHLAEAPRYERTMHGWVDAPEPPAFTMTVRLADPWVGVELVAVATSSPEYAIQEARGRVLVGPEARIDRALGAAMQGLGGLSMTPGFTRKVTELTGERIGAAYFVDAAIELARLIRQVARVPHEVIQRHWPEGPVGVWRLDMQGWVDFPSSCYTFRPETERLFADRTVQAPAQPVLYNPPGGAMGVFNRTKVARLERQADRLVLSHSMFDELHAFQVWVVVNSESHTVVDAGSLTSRLPYMGICSDVQGHVRGLVGQRVDAGLRKRLGGLVGGTTGCSQLYDLTADLLKLLTLT
jgi:hypothetical protein